MNWAQVINGQVVNCIVWDGETPLELEGELVQYTEENPAYIGGTYKDGVFFPPLEPLTETI